MTEIKKLSGSKVELTITVAYEDYKKAEKTALEKIGKEIKVDGFRSGHIPEEVIRERVGQDTIMQFTIEEALPLSYARAVKEHNVQVVARPKIDIKTPVEKEGDGLVYTATVAVMPEVKIGDYKKIKVKKEPIKIEAKQVDETITMVMDRFAEWVDVERTAQKGDRVEVDFEGFDTEDKALPNTASRNHPIILGQGNMVPGFEEAIVGMKKDENKEFVVTFPEKYHAASMQGKEVKFKLKLGRLEEKKPQHLDEAMVEKITGQKKTPEEFRKMVEDDLMKEMETRAQSEHDNKVVQEVIKITKVELPDELIEDEIAQMMDEQKSRVQAQGLTWEQYLSHIKKSETDFAADHKKAATERLTARLGVNQIIKDAGITATDEETEAKLTEIMNRYPADQQAQVSDYYKKGSEAYQGLKNNLAADKLIALLSA